MIYPNDFESKIGFDIIRKNLVSSCSSRLGREEAERMRFSTDFATVMHRLKCVNEVVEIISRDLPFPVIASHDILPYLTDIRAQNSFMSADRLYKLMLMLQSFEEIAAFFISQNEDSDNNTSFPELEKVIDGLSLFPEILKIINKSINKFGEIKDNASPVLYELRQQIKHAQGSMQRAMKRVLDSAIASGIVEKDATPSIRDGRLVLPVISGNKRKINGIIHDESSSGKTVFIEPSQVVEAGNRIRELELEEKREITIILTAIANSIRPEINNIANSCRILGKLDFIFAKGRFAIDMNACLPHISESPEIEWYHAVHPSLVISLKSSDRTVIPLDITLSHSHRILIISGPNAGGKSVCLKTTATVQYMMQCGLLPTLYDNSHMGCFNNLFIDIGDEQSFENDLSTYSSHLKNMKFFLNHADKKTLLLADEMGSGTEPQIGGAIAQAILTQLGHSGCYGIITTHYQNLKSFAENEPGFINGAMLYDRAHLKPTYQLSIGNPGSSFAIDIAHKMGLPKNVIEDAKKIVGEDYVNLDKYLSDIARDKKYWTNKRLNIREKENRLDNLLSKYEDIAGDLKSQRKAILADARKEAQEIIDNANAKIERTILEIRKVQADKEKTKRLRAELKEFSDNNRQFENVEDKKIIKNLRHKSKKSQKVKIENKILPEIKKELMPGDYVTLDGSTMAGKILVLNGNKADVAFGSLRMQVNTDRLKYSKPPKNSALTESARISSDTYAESRERQLNFKNEIDIRGMRGDEALQAVTYFIDDAIQFGASRIRILHGTGHGILKTLIRQNLKANNAVASFHDEDIRFGGAGITVVDIE